MGGGGGGMGCIPQEPDQIIYVAMIGHASIKDTWLCFYGGGGGGVRGHALPNIFEILDH